MTIKAVIFDIGGVCVGSPMAGIHAYEQKHGLPRNYINVAIVRQGENGAFQKLERGELKLNDFYKDFGLQLSDPTNKEHYKEYLKKTGKPVPEYIPDVHVDGKELFKTMMLETARIDPYIYSALQCLKESGKYTLAALTNNFELPEDDLQEAEAMGASAAIELRGIFDYFIESRLVGLRKPDPNFFLHACRLLNIQPNEAIFLDDIGMNLRSASQLGMKTIQVKMGHSKEAVKQLESLTGLDLLGKVSKSKL
ncbi:epoxide hydrolase N-termina [Rhizopus microsporus]|uniref:Epoxide hydrolase N-termina n=1 Tax=Rhizopus microsporus TaxID=58291 RepID=A0A1X0S5I3_RHIZD|nr:epoxide hydrolase N-termina [Rhizopus microsporus]